VRETALALCALSLLCARPLAAQLLVDPLEVNIITAGDTRVSASFTIANQSDNVVQATITRQDWDRAENGDNRFLTAGTSGASCGAILSASPISIRVESHSSRLVRLGVQNAGSLTKECWDIFFVEEVPQRATTRGNSLQYIFRTGIKVYVAPPGLKGDGAVEDMAVVDAPLLPLAASSTPASPVTGSIPATKKQINIRFHNTGGMNLLAAGRVEFRRFDNTVAAKLEIPEFPTLPGAVRNVLIDPPASLPSGDYVVLALIDFGGAEVVAGQIDYRAK
jgi:P pilus assembly chaperone PapD